MKFAPNVGLLVCAVPALAACVKASPVPAEPAAMQAKTAPEAPFAPGQRQLVRRGHALQYRPCPANLPAGCEIAVLEGNPKHEGLFTIRIRTSQPFVLPPHTHPQAERVTVLAGQLHIGFGTKVDKSESEAFGPGDYYVNAPGAAHFVWADENVSIQLTGFGPWKIQLHDEPAPSPR